MKTTYKIIYFLCLISTAFIAWFKYKINDVNYYDLLTVLSIITSLVTTIFIFINNKKTIQKKELILPISYIIFLIAMSVFAYTYNIYSTEENLVYSYYYKIVLIPFICLNLYTILLFSI
jgi:hypothetical protein